MAISSAVRVSKSKLVIRGRSVLSGVPDNIVTGAVVTSGPVDAIFLDAEFSLASNRHIDRDLWWIAQRMGNQGRDIPYETQFLLLESKTESFNGVGDDEADYAVFLLLAEGPFRACLQGNARDELELCLESGDEDAKSTSFSHALFLRAAASDPFAAITGAVETVKSHLRTFRHRKEKKLPGIEGVEAGIRSLSDGGDPPRFVIIDDGWQSVSSDDDDSGDGKPTPLLRLTGIKENGKFQSKGDPAAGIKTIIRTAKKNYGLKYVYVDGERAGMKTDNLTAQGLGLVNPKSVYKFYNELHSYLAAAGVDGVKVDEQCILETLGGELGGRVELTGHSKQTAVARASDDFYPRESVSHTIHIASVAYNSVFLGEIMLRDWDMFTLYIRRQSTMPLLVLSVEDQFISGELDHVYIITILIVDVPGKHNFKLLKKLVLPDRSTLRARLPGGSDPLEIASSLIPLVMALGVIGLFNCQGAAWSSTEKKNICHSTSLEALSCSVTATDVHLISEAASDHRDWSGDCVTFRQTDRKIVVLPRNAVIPDLAPGLRFAPVGLVDRYNAGAAVVDLTYHVLNVSSLSEDCTSAKGPEAAAMVCMEVKGCGRFGAYSSVKPRRCLLDSADVEFAHDSVSGFLAIHLENMPKAEKKLHNLVVEF
ncbi:hypothetical protein ZIOFF_000137 [Zingiber officinale]|uniref:Galactinol--sucrose galactosyltransferase n=1 Tax=Zingiber officinale TaxID=94328 RepID=A0A8J5IHG8_ZINOF|nr:hypothetical protein ZIOFF_000137 [Zingiber officinale]